ncbi:hypothetical protein D3C85_1666310 [compost metagenome]
MRYAAEAYPQLQHSNPRLQKALRRAQGDLGSWHDLLQWLLQAEQQSDLAPCVSHWQMQLTKAEQCADATLDRLQEQLAQR